MIELILTHFFGVSLLDSRPSPNLFEEIAIKVLKGLEGDFVREEGQELLVPDIVTAEGCYYRFGCHLISKFLVEEGRGQLVTCNKTVYVTVQKPEEKLAKEALRKQGLLVNWELLKIWRAELNRLDEDIEF